MVMAQASIQVLAADANHGGLPVVLGVPFEKGAVRAAGAITLTGPSGKACPVAARPLVSWPDGSIRWGLLTLLAGETGEHRVSWGQKPGGKGATPASQPAVEGPVRLQRSGDEITLDNGLVRVVLSTTGPGPIRRITALGKEYLDRPEALRFVVNDADTTREQGRTAQVLEESPLRTRVRLAGAHFDAAGKRLLNYRLDVELWANQPSMRVDYHFFHLEPGRPEIPIQQMAMKWDTTLGQATQRHFLQTMYSLMYLPREVHNPAAVSLVTDEHCAVPHVEDPAMLLDDLQYPAHLRPPLVSTTDWLGVGDGEKSIYVKMQDFMQMRPKRLASSGSGIELEFWPARAGTMQLPQGRSRRQVIVLAFANQPSLPGSEAARLLEAPLHEGRALVSPSWLRQTGEFENDRHMAPAAHVRFEKYLRRMVYLQSPQTMFDLGDTIDSGYCVTYPPIPNNSILKRNAPALPRVFQASLHSPLMHWSLPQIYEPVYTNNEYDGLFALCSEIMRCGRSELWNNARWLARHNLEVDFIHYHDDQQQNRATPQHSANHNTSGSVPSHYWTQGLLQYYCLTGDPDVLEIAMALGDKIIEDFTVPQFRQSFWSFTRELGWPTLALAHLMDITGQARYRKQLEEMLAYYLGLERGEGFERALTPGLWAWSCMFEGVDLYVRRTGRKDVKAWLVDFLNKQRDGVETWDRQGRPLTVMAAMVMAIGYEQTGDKRFLEAGLTCVEEMTDHEWWTNPPGEIKPMAITYRGLVRYLHHASQAGLLEYLEYAGQRLQKGRPAGSKTGKVVKRAKPAKRSKTKAAPVAASKRAGKSRGKGQRR